MTDLVARLRALAGNHPDGMLEREAADEIERLREVLTDLRERSVEEGIQHFVTRIDAALTTGKRHD